jgi:hypothetical protein
MLRNGKPKGKKRKKRKEEKKRTKRKKSFKNPIYRTEVNKLKESES